MRVKAVTGARLIDGTPHIEDAATILKGSQIMLVTKEAMIKLGLGELR